MRHISFETTNFETTNQNMCLCVSVYLLGSHFNVIYASLVKRGAGGTGYGIDEYNIKTHTGENGG